MSAFFIDAEVSLNTFITMWLFIYLYSFGDVSFSFGPFWEDQICCLESVFYFLFGLFYICLKEEIYTHALGSLVIN